MRADYGHAEIIIHIAMKACFLRLYEYRNINNINFFSREEKSWITRILVLISKRDTNQ